MRILFVSTNLPVPANNGQAIRTLSIVRALHSLGHELTFVSFARAGLPPNLDPLSSWCGTVDLLEENGKLTNMSQRQDWYGRLRCLLSRKPYAVERFRSSLMHGKIAQRLKESSFDLIFCDSLYALVNVPRCDIPIALNCHNVEHLIPQRYADLERNHAKKLYARIESHLLREAEREACRRAAFAMACSENDRSIFVRMRRELPTFIVPNAVDTEAYRSAADSANQTTGSVVLFQGGMDWYPNRDAVEFFAESIFPLVRAACPGVKFVVAGRNPPAYFIEKFRSVPDIEFTGTVPDMLPYLAAATVAVVPLRLGSGTRIKILEACAAGRAVVSTSVGAEGLNLEPGKEILLSDDPSHFARSVVEMLQDPVRRNAIGAAARSAVVKRYSEPALKSSVRAALSSFAGPQVLAEADRVGSCLDQSA